MSARILGHAAIATGLVSFGVLVGGVSVALFTSPDAFLTGIGKVQGIVASVVALVAAGTGYAAATAKVRSDERQVLKSAAERDDAVTKEFANRARVLMQHVRDLEDSSYTASEVGDIAHLLNVDVQRSRSFVTRAWMELDRIHTTRRSVFGRDLMCFELALDHTEGAARIMDRLAEKEGRGNQTIDLEIPGKMLSRIFNLFPDKNSTIGSIAATFRDRPGRVTFIPIDHYPPI